MLHHFSLYDVLYNMITQWYKLMSSLHSARVDRVVSNTLVVIIVLC
jgi:hypothetical protein